MPRHSPSQVVFELWGDGRQLWQSASVNTVKVSCSVCLAAAIVCTAHGGTGVHWFGGVYVSPQTPLPFDVNLLKVEQLELRVSCGDKNKHCHAVWIDPALTVSRGRCCRGEARKSCLLRFRWLGRRHRLCHGCDCCVTEMRRLDVCGVEERQGNICMSVNWL